MASRSRTSSCTGSARYLALLGVVASAGWGCNRKTEVAELTTREGPVDRKTEDTDAWAQVETGAHYYIGDAARAMAGKATLALTGGLGTLVMTSGTTLRFSGNRKRVVISVVGQIELTGHGEYALDIGDVTLPSDGSTIRIKRPEGGKATFELLIGEPGQPGQVKTAGETYELVLKQPVEVEINGSATVPRDAGVRDAADADVAISASADAATSAVDPARIATIEVTGTRAQRLAPGDTDWQALPQGAGQLAPGTAVRLGPKTTARVAVRGTTLELAGGARFTLGNELQLAVELGTTTATATEPAAIALPGGAIALTGTPDAPSAARLDGSPRDTKIAMLRGGGKLTGVAGAEHDMDRGESATLDRGGTIRYVETIPHYFDFRLVAGETLTIHDPRPPTAVQFQFDGKCPAGGIVEIDRNGSFRSARVSAGRDFANVMIGRGSWAYRLRCTSNGGEGAAVASGRITELTDDGRRPLLKIQPVNDIDADGRTYRISYQSTIPNVVVHVRNPGAAHRLHLASAGREQTFDSSTPSITVAAGQLREGTYTYWIDRDGVKQDKVSTLIIDFDQTAPQVYIESPINGVPWSGDIDVRGAVLPGWSAAVDEIAIPIDKQRRFMAKVGIPGGNSLAIRLAHPQRGVHYYLRRSK